MVRQHTKSCCINLTLLELRPVCLLNPLVLKLHPSLRQDQPADLSPAPGVEVDELDVWHDDALL